MNNIDLFQNCGRVICQCLFAQMIDNELQSSIWTKRRSDDLSEFVDSIDVAQDGYD